MKITKLPLSVSIISLTAVLSSMQHVHASELVTNCTQVSVIGGFDTDSTPDNFDGNEPAEDDESCIKVLIPFDYGDAPDPDFPTLNTSQGASHQLGTDVFLGQCVDSDLGDSALDGLSDDETASSPSWGDCTDPDDEDGVTVSTLTVGGKAAAIDVVASKDCKLNAWIDWNADGDWGGLAEQVFTDEALGEGFNALTVDVPAFAATGDVYARFRCSTLGGDAISGEAADGEVEDYKVTINPETAPTPLSLGNFIWLDGNGDGLQSSGEYGLVGAEVTLLASDGSPARDLNGTVVAPQTIAANGNYLFSNLSAGEYIVSVVAPEGYIPSQGGDDPDTNDSNTDSNCVLDQGVVSTPAITLSVGGEPESDIDGDGVDGNLTVDCGFHRPMTTNLTLGDYIWIDEDADGFQDAEESGLAGARVSLTYEGGSTVTDIDGNVVVDQITGATGYYRFERLPEGEYVVEVSPPEGYHLTIGGLDVDSDPNNRDSNCSVFTDGRIRTLPITLANGSEPDATLDGDDTDGNMTADCGFHRSVGVGSRLWIDLDSDGLQDGGEPGVPGATVTLLTPDGRPATDLYGSVVAPVVSGSNGEYFFGNLREGDYIIQVTPPGGYEPTVATGDPDDNDGQDSNGTVISGNSVASEPITLSWGDEPDNDGDGDKSTNLTVGFGFLASRTEPGGAAQIPTASGWTLGLMSLLLSLVAFWRRRKDS